MRITDVDGRDLLFQLDDLLTPEECATLIARAHAVQTSSETGDKSWHPPTDNTGQYSRVVMWDRDLAADLWERVRGVLPDKHRGYSFKYINPCFRFSRYDVDGKFPLHTDGKNYDNGPDGIDTESLFTLNIFLNDDFKGGATDFFSKRGRSARLRSRVEPQTGRAALFWADQLHRGNTVETPYKYLIRTDVMGVRDWGR